MSNYTKTTDFEAKDSLPSGDSGKIIRGSEFETEFDNIATAIASKSDANNPTFTGTVTIDGLTVNGNTVLGNAATDTVTVTADIASNLLPSADDTYNLGAVGAEWNDLHVDGVAYIDTIAGFATTGNVTFGDNDKAIFGASSDLQIYHTGSPSSNSVIEDAGAGNLTLKSNGAGIHFRDGSDNLVFNVDLDSATTLYHNTSAKLATTNTGIDVTGSVSADGLTVSGVAYIQSTTTPQLELAYNSGNITGFYRSGGDFQIKNDNGAGTPETSIVLAEDGAVSLYHDASAKLATTSTGVDVTGTVTADGLTVDGTNAGLTITGPSSQLMKIATTSSLDKIAFAGGDGTVEAMRIDSNGDISFYEDTGTTVKMNWDASAESLGIGVGTPQASLHIANDASRTQFIASGTVGNDRFVAIDVDISGLNDVAYITVDQADALAFGEKTNDNDRTILNEHMRIDAGGNVGIGTDSPGSALEVADSDVELRITDTRNQSFTAGDTIASLGFYSDDTSGNSGGANNLPRGAIDVVTTNTFGSIHDMVFRTRGDEAGTASEKVRITNNGSLLVGQTTQTPNNVGVSLNANGNISAKRDGGIVGLFNRGTSDGIIADFRKDGVSVGSIGTEGGDLHIYSSASGHKGLRFGIGYIAPTNNSGAVNDSNVDLGYGGGSPARFKDLYLSGTANVEKVTAERTNGVCAEFRRSNDGHAVQFFHAGALVGSVAVTSTATAYNTSSDQRLKENIADADDAGSKVDAIQVRKFDWKADGSHQDYGMVAQELNTVAPEAVTEGDTEEDMMSVDYSKLVPMLVKEIQSLRARVAQLEGEA